MTAVSSLIGWRQVKKEKRRGESISDNLFPTLFPLFSLEALTKHATNLLAEKRFPLSERFYSRLLYSFGSIFQIWNHGVAKAFLRGCALAILLLSTAMATADDAASVELSADLLIRHQKQMECLSLSLKSTDHKPSETLQKAFDLLFQFVDADGDGQLNADEQPLLPTPQALRQSAWNPYSLMLRRAQPPDDWDTDENGLLSPEEVRVGYGREGLGILMMAVGYPPNTEALNRALIEAIDRNQDGLTTAAEWKQAELSLLKRDSNQDALIGPSELIGPCVYPGATGSIFWNPTSSQRLLRQQASQADLTLLPANVSDSQWSHLLLDHLGQATGSRPEKMTIGSQPSQTILEMVSPEIIDELIRWRHAPDRPRWIAIVDPQSTSASPDQSPPENAKTIAVGQLLVRFESRTGRLPLLVSRGRARIEAAFLEHDADKDGIARFEVRGNYDSESLPFRDADRNRDEQLSREELMQWLELHETLAKAQLVFTVLDWGPGLFETLDTNHDGSLSIRELRGAWETLDASRCTSHEQLNPEMIPHHVTLFLSQGHPLSMLNTEGDSAMPNWFQYMDRNHDGDIAREEFLGSPDRFQILDRNQDGLLSPAEARAAE